VPLSVRRFSLVSAVALCAIVGGPIAVAQASDNTLRQTINSFGPKISKDENAVKNGLNGYPKVRPLTRALKQEVGDLQSFKRKLSHEHASSSAGRTAKTDIVKGLGLIASAYGALRTDVLAANGAPVPAAQRNSVLNTDKKGIKKYKAGFKLLKLPTA
jgi:hypothetical protein